MTSINAFFSSLVSKKGLPLLLLTLAFLLIMLISLAYIGLQQHQSQQNLQSIAELQTLSQKIPLVTRQSNDDLRLQNQLSPLLDEADTALAAIASSKLAQKLKFIPHLTETDLSSTSSALSSLRLAVENSLSNPYNDPQSTLYPASEQLLSQTQTLMQRTQDIISDTTFAYWITLLSGLLFLGSFLFLAARPLGASAEALVTMEDQNRDNQDAILRLLDEMGDLADGDLTVSATVTDDMTGAIADSINYTVDALRDLVENINSTTLQVSSAAQESQASSMHLSDASSHQAEQITDVNTTLTTMVESIEKVASDANQSAEVAAQSVTLATQGNEAVQKSISGMNTIREHIQETSKRMKRLGESSQEIGEIVELINDIAEQTNILSLNASIQAAMAGESGRGFAVVADEVQRLAERSGNATKQIDALVKTIQSDTNEAISSMERSTAEVVSGAKMSQDAGASLEQIQGVSQQLATMIQSISTVAKEQAAAAGNTSDAMNVIQEISLQTSTGTTESAASVGRLLELVNDLRTSVSGFKLPS